MKIDPNKLQKISNFAEEKGLTRQHVYRLIKNGEINQVIIDGVKFVLLDEQAKQYKRKRKA
jgi:predicted site-specific integrase-resolvase